MSTHKKSTTTTRGFGFVGRWNDGRLGWSMPHVLSGNPRRFPDSPEAERSWARHAPHYLCEITVRLIKDKRGRPIVRYLGGKKAPR